MNINTTINITNYGFNPSALPDGASGIPARVTAAHRERYEITSCDLPRRFFAENNFYTTAVNRMTRGFWNGAVTLSDAETLCGLNADCAGRRTVGADLGGAAGDASAQAASRSPGHTVGEGAV